MTMTNEMKNIRKEQFKRFLQDERSFCMKQCNDILHRDNTYSSSIQLFHSAYDYAEYEGRNSILLDALIMVDAIDDPDRWPRWFEEKKAKTDSYIKFLNEQSAKGISSLKLWLGDLLAESGTSLEIEMMKFKYKEIFKVEESNDVREN